MLSGISVEELRISVEGVRIVVERIRGSGSDSVVREVVGEGMGIRLGLAEEYI